MEAGVIFTITLDEVKNEPVIGDHKHNLCLCFIGAIEVFSMWENTWKKKWDKILQQFSNLGFHLNRWINKIANITSVNIPALAMW